MSSFDVITLGLAVMDITVSPVEKDIFSRDTTPVDDIVVCPGGDAANEAIALKKLGLESALCCRIGADSMGGLFLSVLRSCGVDPSHIAVSPDSVTSTAIALVSPDGDRNIICAKGNNYDFCFADIDLSFIENTRALSIGSFFGMPKLEEDGGLMAALKKAKSCGVITFAVWPPIRRDKS